jgi:hypothetical protein
MELTDSDSNERSSFELKRKANSGARNRNRRAAGAFPTAQTVVGLNGVQTLISPCRRVFSLNPKRNSSSNLRVIKYEVQMSILW